MARSPRRSGSGFACASAERPSVGAPHEHGDGEEDDEGDADRSGPWLFHGVDQHVPCSNRTKTIRAANTSPRSNHLVMGPSA